MVRIYPCEKQLRQMRDHDECKRDHKISDAGQRVTVALLDLNECIALQVQLRTAKRGRT
jgi:hypothetical protein